MFKYKVNQSSEVIITGYTGNDTEVIIPSEIKGNPVTSIGCAAFQYCNSLTSVTIPESVTSIGDYAFSYCISLKAVYYTGTAEQWGKIAIGSYNRALNKAKKHFKIF